MKKILALTPLFLLIGITLSSTNTIAAQAAVQAKPRNYLELPTTGKYSAVPYVWEREKHGKYIAVIGTHHNRDPRSPMFGRMEAVFKRVRPQLVIHESEAPAALMTMPRDQAIKIGADLGFAVYLAGQYGAVAQSGDAPVKEEFKILLAHYPAADVLVFLTAQRLIGSARNPDLQAAAAEYPDFLKSYLVQNGLPAQPGWETWQGFLREYARVVGHPLSSKSWDPDLVSPVKDSGRLSEIARSSDTFRDSHLLATIKTALNEHDRVVVVFGAWHVLTLEPVLNDLLKDQPGDTPRTR